MADLLKGKVGIITGASRGMGKAIAKTFAHEGATVGLLDIQEEELNQVVNEIQADGGKALGLVTDVRYYDQVERSVQSIIEKFGAIDILVNSAGLSGNGLVHEISEADWDTCFDIMSKERFCYVKQWWLLCLSENKVRLLILDIIGNKHKM